jgi:ribosomal protein S18 acetylase RimI-like enzyme
VIEVYIIRRAEEKDSESCIKLLKEICNIHAKIRPDLFKENMTKYSIEELKEMFNDDSNPIFVYEENNMVLGYCFCQIIVSNNIVNPKPIKTLYIDDLCVDESVRGKHIGEKLYNYVIDYARDINCYNVTLNVWEGNDGAKAFYKKMGLKAQKTYMEKIL